MRILFIGFPDSIHTARWINQIAGQEWDIHLFPVHDGPVHPDLRSVTIHSFFRTWPFSDNSQVTRKGLHWPILSGRGKIKSIVKLASPGLAADSKRLATTIRSLNPDIIHVLEMQHAGYLSSEALQQLNGRPYPPVIYSSWGSDFYRYGNLPDHRQSIREFLGRCDYYIADCRRDLELASRFGFAGEALGVYPAGGGFDLREPRRLKRPFNERNVILVKGYHGDRLLGRALVALAAIRKCERLLENYEVLVYSADSEVSEEIQMMTRETKIRISQVPQSAQLEMLRLMGRSRIAIGVGLSDGTPISLLEAMMMGAFPIQSDTVSTAEWIESGSNGLLVPAEDSDAIAQAIRRALTDDELVRKAAEQNARIIADRVDTEKITPEIIRLYERVASSGCVKNL